MPLDNRHLLSSSSTFGNTYGNLALKQENYSDSEDYNLDKIVQNHKRKFKNEGNEHSESNDEVTGKKEAVSSANGTEEESSQGRWKLKPEKQQENYSDSEDFDRMFKNEGEYRESHKVTVKQEADCSANEAQFSQGSWKLKTLEQSGNAFPEKLSMSECFGFIRSCLNAVLSVDSEKRHELVQAMSSKLKYIEAVATSKSRSKGVVSNSEVLSNSNSAKLIKEKSNIDEQHDFDESDGKEEDNKTDDEMVRKVEKSSCAGKFDQLGLVRQAGDGSVQCNICDRLVNSTRNVCAACSSYVSRTRTKCRETGTSLPSCHHRDFKGGANCNSCRLRKYILLSKRDPLPPSRRMRWTEGRPKKVSPRVKRKVQSKKKTCKSQKCMICEKKSPWFKAWRCSACFIFHTRLIARYQAGEELPECNHDGDYAGVGCKGCRRIRLQRESALREPELAGKLPEMLITNAANLDKDDD